MKCINSGSSGNGYALISDDEVLLKNVEFRRKKCCVRLIIRQVKLPDALSLMSMVKETMQSISSST